MSHFPVSGNDLVVGGIPLSQLVARVGNTPFYAYDRQMIRNRVEALRQALPAAIKLHYAMKANPMPAVVGFMVGLVDGIDVASAGELKIALDAGVFSGDVSFAGPGKRSEDIRKAVASGVLVNVESFREIDELRKASEALGVPARIAIRVNPDFELKGSGMKMGGGAKQFGVDAEKVPELMAEIRHSGLKLEGFHLFSGSQNLNASLLCETQQKSYELARSLAALAQDPVKVLNLGGGFGIPYFPGDVPLDLRSVGENLTGIAERAARELPQCELVIELGRYLVGEAGVYVSRVVDRKDSRGLTFLVVDGGLNHHLSASGNFGQVIRRNFPVVIGNRMHSADFETVSVVGPLCTPLDLLADKVSLPETSVGDYVVILQSGAYGATASPQQFLGHGSVAEVLVG